jgi:hypothetical protein
MFTNPDLCIAVWGLKISVWGRWKVRELKRGVKGAVIVCGTFNSLRDV